MEWTIIGSLNSMPIKPNQIIIQWLGVMEYGKLFDQTLKPAFINILMSICKYILEYKFWCNKKPDNKLVMGFDWIVQPKSMNVFVCICSTLDAVHFDD